MVEIETLNENNHLEKQDFDEFYNLVWTAADKEHFPAGLPMHMHLRGEETFYYRRDGKILGYVKWKWEMGVAYIFATAVHPEHRREGIATALKLELEKRARERLCHKIFTETGVGWGSTHLNEKLGYETVVVIPDHYAHESFILSQKTLRYSQEESP